MKNLEKNNGVATPAIIGAVIVALIASSAIIYTVQGEEEGDKEIETGTSAGKKAPNFSLKDLTGEKFSLKELRGKIVILDFMATWCPPCKAEMRNLFETRREFDKSELAIASIGIDPSEDTEQLKNFKNNYDADWRFAKGGSIGTLYNIKSIATILIIEKQGKITYRKVGI